MTVNAQKGFSLPELLVALLIFSIIAGTGVVIMRMSVDANDQFRRADQKIAAVELTRAILKDDLTQIALRPVRDEFGAVEGPTFRDGAFDVSAAAAGETVLFAFVRRGWTNPEWVSPRSSLQRVEYLESGNMLVRRTRPFLDGARGQPTTEQVLIDNIDGAKIEFLTGQTSGRLDWSQTWPPRAGVSGAPLAIAITLQTPRFGELRQLFWIGDVAGTEGAGDDQP